MFNKLNFQVERFASNEESRYTLKAILVTPQATVATDGHMLTWISRPKQNVANFPLVPDFDGPTEDFKPFLVPKEVAKKIATDLPTKPGTVPILSCAALSVKKNGKDGEVRHTFARTTLDTHMVYTFREMGEHNKFPNYHAVIPDPKKAKAQVAFNPHLLKAALDAVIALFSGEPAPMVVLSVYDDREAIRLDAANSKEQGVTSVIMPMRYDYENVFKHTYHSKNYTYPLPKTEEGPAPEEKQDKQDSPAQPGSEAKPEGSSNATT